MFKCKHFISLEEEKAGWIILMHHIIEHACNLSRLATSITGIETEKAKTSLIAEKLMNDCLLAFAFICTHTEYYKRYNKNPKNMRMVSHIIWWLIELWIPLLDIYMNTYKQMQVVWDISHQILYASLGYPVSFLYHHCVRSFDLRSFHSRYPSTSYLTFGTSQDTRLFNPQFR